ncbi:PREDICTED: UPF0691 protein C9orf116 homolog isoform X2 [Dipodomys ordii]|uniref:UPF0691 protein C9orf116 homolog isoform X2 n=1 Tax=Dipodomys ordii TaxID=10020 RepID=A0A1S3G7S5_DIPOR|nr:PREDICTED: UPF0691 protein C9orf116 homolog isoform X2 [Dipodomys ordii]
MSEEHPEECKEIPPECEKHSQEYKASTPQCEDPPQDCGKPVKRKAKAPEKTSDYYRVSKGLPVRFNNPACFQGYRSQEVVSLYRTSNQTYGSRAPTVHEMPNITQTQTSFPNTRQLAECSRATFSMSSWRRAS